MIFTKHSKKRAKERFVDVNLDKEIKSAKRRKKRPAHNGRKLLKSKSGITFVVEGNTVITVY